MFTLSNGKTGDFSWGFMLSMQFLTVVSLACAFDKENDRVGKKRKGVVLAIYAYQVFVGLQYYLELVHLKDNWI